VVVEEYTEEDLNDQDDFGLSDKFENSTVYSSNTM